MPQLTATRLQGCSGAFRQRVSRNAFAKSCLPCTSARMPRLGLFKTNRSSWQELCHFCIQYQGYGTFRGQQHCCGTRRVQLVQLVSMFGLLCLDDVGSRGPYCRLFHDVMDFEHDGASKTINNYARRWCWGR